MSKKVWVMVGALCAAAAAVAAVCVVLAGGKNEAYRSIMVYQVNGNATITRARVGEMAAYENLMLQSGDSVAVASESSMRLKLDDDKYILAEQDTLMNIVAEGDDENSKTYIDLQKGSVTSEIQSKLKEGASYEVNTPNAIMAVRGTIFRVDVEFDSNGNPQTKLTVLQGTVAAKAIMPDGTVSDEEALVEAGNELMIDGTLTTFGDMSAPGKIDYDSLPLIVTEYIEELKQTGTLLARNEIKNDAADADEQEFETMPNQDTETPVIQEPEQLEPQQADLEEPEEQEAAQPDVTDKKQENKPKAPGKPGKKPSEEEKPEQSEQPKSEEQESKPQATEQPETTSSEAEQPKSEIQESEAESQTKSEPASQTEPSSQAPSGGGDSSGDSDSSGGSSGGGSSDKTTYYTVTFQYNGSTFGTQKVKKGDTATEPKLCPAPNGSWDYDFSTKVNKNLVVQWKEQ